jgi:hypothetical protein
MSDLKRRLAAAERILARRRPRIVRVIIENCPDGLSEDDAESRGLRYHRTPGETVEAFRERASNDAEARGRVTIVFGHRPPKPTEGFCAGIGNSPAPTLPRKNENLVPLQECG